MPLPSHTRIQYVHLYVQNLARMAHFYLDILGFRPIDRKHHTLYLSATGQFPPHLILEQLPQAISPPAYSTGLYHLAIRFPTRKALAHTFAHLVQQKITFQGFSDHKVSEAIYFRDPEGNGIEIYWDKPESVWPRQNGQIEMITTPLDTRSLLQELEHPDISYTGLDAGTDIGHVHLKVSSLHKAETFYHGIIGLNITQRTYPGALFFAAGTYHHHVGTNIWHSKGAPPPPKHATGLNTFSILIPEAQAWFDVIERLQATQRPVEQWLKTEDFLGLRTRDLDHIGVDLLMPHTSHTLSLWEEAQPLFQQT